MKTPRLFALAVASLSIGASSCLVPDGTAELALCCTCLEQKSPINDADAADPSTNCLPDDTEVDGCNETAADVVLDPDNAPAIMVTDELCNTQTCQDECRPATLRGARFEVDQQGLTE
ncbi:MAG: hypothetical protein HYS27_15750 [Deltaproteobacteria bacterium]|nr:hypothetical protein [Deltaproteobacteria bacterium]